MSALAGCPYKAGSFQRKCIGPGPRKLSVIMRHLYLKWGLKSRVWLFKFGTATWVRCKTVEQFMWTSLLGKLDVSFFVVLTIISCHWRSWPSVLKYRAISIKIQKQCSITCLLTTSGLPLREFQYLVASFSNLPDDFSNYSPLEFLFIYPTSKVFVSI